MNDEWLPCIPKLAHSAMPQHASTFVRSHSPSFINSNSCFKLFQKDPQHTHRIPVSSDAKITFCPQTINVWMFWNYNIPASMFLYLYCAFAASENIHAHTLEGRHPTSGVSTQMPCKTVEALIFETGILSVHRMNEWIILFLQVEYETMAFV